MGRLIPPLAFLGIPPKPMLLADAYRRRKALAKSHRGMGDRHADGHPMFTTRTATVLAPHRNPVRHFTGPAAILLATGGRVTSPFGGSRRREILASRRAEASPEPTCDVGSPQWSRAVAGRRLQFGEGHRREQLSGDEPDE